MMTDGRIDSEEPVTVDGVPPFCSDPPPNLSHVLANSRWGGDTRQIGAPPPAPSKWEQAMRRLPDVVAANTPAAGQTGEGLREQARALKRQGRLSNRKIAVAIGLTASDKDEKKVQRWTADIPNAPRSRR